MKRVKIVIIKNSGEIETVYKHSYKAFKSFKTWMDEHINELGIKSYQIIREVSNAS